MEKDEKVLLVVVLREWRGFDQNRGKTMSRSLGSVPFLTLV